MTSTAELERAFRAAGLPSFIAARTAREDVWTRAIPLLGLVLFAEVLGAVDLQVSALTNGLLVLAALAVLLGALMLLNVARGRPARSRPEDVGIPELVGFVVVPALLPLLLNDQPVSALVTAGANLALLLVLYGVIGYGVLSIVAWAGRRLLGQLASALSLLARAIPLLLLFSVVLFINTEMWQVFGELDNLRVAGLVVLLTALATGFLLVRLPREVEALEADVLGDAPPLDRRETINVALVMLVAQGLQVLVVAAAVGGFFVALGLLTISTELTQTWTGTPVHVLAGGGGFAVTAELVRVAVAIAGFSGFYYAIAVVTDATYREEFAAELTDEMRQSFRDRAAYREALAAS